MIAVNVVNNFSILNNFYMRTASKLFVESAALLSEFPNGMLGLPYSMETNTIAS